MGWYRYVVMSADGMAFIGCPESVEGRKRHEEENV
jgi:hypothetical protein